MRAHRLRAIKPSPCLLSSQSLPTRCSHCRRLHQGRLTLSEQIRAIPFPPPTSGDIKARLAQWQREGGRALSDPITAEAEARTLQSLTQGESTQQDDATNSEPLLSFEAEAGELGSIQLRHYILPGSLVEITPRFSVKDPVFAISLVHRGGNAVLLTINGRIVSIKEKFIQWHQPQWIEPSELIGLDPYLPKDDIELSDDTDDIKVHDFGVPRDITGPIITKLSGFRNNVHSVYGKHASTLDNAHDLLADQVELQFGSLSRIAQKLVGVSEKSITPELLYTVRKALHRFPIGFNPVSSLQRKTQLWQIRPKAMVEDAELARKWIRQYRDALAADEIKDPQLAAQWRSTEGFRIVNNFVHHCRQLIDESRKSRPRNEHGLLAARSSEKCEVKRGKAKPFTSSTSLLIRFIEYWCLQSAFQHDQSLSSLPPFLIKSIERYADIKSTSYAGALLLQEIGCLPPYANQRLLQPELMLPGRGLSVRLDQIYETVQNTSESAVAKDTMKDLRYDWGDLPVYCIDPVGTTDVDDGISVQKVDGNVEKYWIRVHVANPSAFLRPDSNVGAMARQLAATFYSADATISMLPPVFRRQFSLRSGSPAMTISFLVDRQGNILEHDIRAARIHNVYRTTYAEVDELLGTTSNPVVEPSPLIVGASLSQMSQERGKRHQADGTRSLNNTHGDTLSLLNELSLQIRSTRGRAGGSITERSPVDEFLRLYRSPQELHQPAQFPTHFQSEHSVQYLGDPIIHAQRRPMTPAAYLPMTKAHFGSKHMVAELMITAGISSAKWSWDRRLPQPYRTQMIRSTEAEIQRFRDDVLAPNFANKTPETMTWADALLSSQAASHFLPAFALTKPANHISLGVPQYIKATSPLRRYLDMLAHWQIEAALRHEAQTGQSLVTTDASRALPASIPFTDENVQALISRVVDRERLLNTAQDRSEEHWTALLYHRALYSPSSACTQIPGLMPDRPFQIVITGMRFVALPGTSQMMIHGINVEHGVHQVMLHDPQLHKATNGVQLFDTWECVLDSVEVSTSSIVVKPLRLVERVDPAKVRAYELETTRLSKVIPQAPVMAH